MFINNRNKNNEFGTFSQQTVFPGHLVPSVPTKRVLPPDVPGAFPSCCMRMANAVSVSINRSLCVKPLPSLKSILMKILRACATETIALYTSYATTMWFDSLNSFSTGGGGGRCLWDGDGMEWDRGGGGCNRTTHLWKSRAKEYATNTQLYTIHKRL